MAARFTYSSFWKSSFQPSLAMLAELSGQPLQKQYKIPFFNYIARMPESQILKHLDPQHQL